MHQIGSGMYVSGRAPDPDTKRERRRLSSGSAATPPYTGGDVSRSGELGRMFDVAAAAAAWQSQAPSPASSSRRSSGPLQQQAPARPTAPSPGPLSQLSHSGLLVGPSPSPGPSPARGGSSSWRKKASRRMRAGKEETAVTRGRARLGVPFACRALVLAAAAGGAGAGVFCVVAWRRWEALAVACGAVACAAALFFWNVARCAAEAESFFRRSPDTVFDDDDDQGGLPVGELVKITGQVTCGRVPLGACFHDGARCVFTSVQMYGRRGWAWACCCRRWQLKHSEVKFLSKARSTNFYISDRNTGRRFYVRAGEGGAKMTWMIKKNTVSFDGGDSKGAPRRSLENWAASHGLSCAGAVRVEEGFIREGDTASVIGVLKKHHACDIVDAPDGVVATGCQPARCMFPVLVEGLVLIGSDDDPDEAVYMV